VTNRASDGKPLEAPHSDNGGDTVTESYPYPDLFSGPNAGRHEPRYSHHAFTPITAQVWAVVLAGFDGLAASFKVAEREMAASLLPAVFRWFVPPEGWLGVGPRCGTPGWPGSYRDGFVDSSLAMGECPCCAFHPGSP